MQTAYDGWQRAQVPGGSTFGLAVKLSRLPASRPAPKQLTVQDLVHGRPESEWRALYRAACMVEPLDLALAVAEMGQPALRTQRCQKWLLALKKSFKIN